MQVRSVIAGMPDAYRHVSSAGYDLPQSLVNVWVSCGINFQLAHDIETDDGANALVHWWFRSGRFDFPGVSESVGRYLVEALHLAHLPAAEARSGQAQSEGADQDHLPDLAGGGQLPLTPLLKIVWTNRKDIQAASDIQTPEGVSALWRWWIRTGSQEYLTRSPTKFDKVRVSRPQGVAARLDPENASPPLRVSLVGYPNGEFGLGEDIRQLRASLTSIGIDPTVIAAPWRISARQNAEGVFVDGDLSAFDTDVAFFVMPAFDTMTLFNKLGPVAFGARRRIGFWQWELDHFPPQALAAVDLVDEIWCHSEHAARAFRKATLKPVHKVPLPVSLPEPHKVPRGLFGLPEHVFIFFTGFDGSSFIARKNPLATILAFQQAFPSAETGPDVGLVIKAMNTRNDSLWRECLRKAANDRRITIIEKVLDHDRYYQLMSNCNAVVSLHRAEGFGRLMAEAMSLGLPVIASRYSGNLDFMTEEDGWLIGGSMVPVMAGDYPFHFGQAWLEPDVGEAAQALKECVLDETKRRRLAAAGEATIRSRYTPEACGRAYRRLLRDGATKN